LWFRGSMVPGSAAPCRLLLLGGSTDDTELLTSIGHLRPAIGKVSGAIPAGIKPRALDLVLLVAETDELPEDAKPLLRRLNRILGSGGILAIDIRRCSGVTAVHPLERHIEGAALLRGCGFMVDRTMAASPVGLPHDISGPDGRAWRAIKIAEFGTGRTPTSPRDLIPLEAVA
jgi:hypothetical protein